MPTLLKIEPGVYDLGSKIIDTGSHRMDIEGSGEDVTIIQGTLPIPSDSLPGDTSPIVVRGEMEIRDLTVENNGGGAGIRVVSATQLRLRDVTILAPNVASQNAGISVTAGANVSIQRSTISAGGVALELLQGSITVTDSHIIGNQYSMWALPGSQISVVSSQVEGVSKKNAGTQAQTICLFSYDAVYQPLSSTC
jgi:hypothetical protein